MTTNDKNQTPRPKVRPSRVAAHVRVSARLINEDGSPQTLLPTPVGFLDLPMSDGRVVRIRGVNIAGIEAQDDGSTLVRVVCGGAYSLYRTLERAESVFDAHSVAMQVYE